MVQRTGNDDLEVVLGRSFLSFLEGEPWWHATKDKFTEERATLMPVVSSTEDTTCDASLENDNARTSESDYEEAMDISPDDERIPSTTAASPGNAAPKFSRRMPGIVFQH